MRKPKKYHYIYKTTNIIKDYFYIGMHSTNNLEDGYLGSGKRIRYSINKYGKENHKFEILEYLPSREELKKREKEIVNEEMLANPQCINLCIGGDGGNGTRNWTEETYKKVNKTSWGNLYLNGFNPDNWSKLSPEEYEVRRQKHSNSASGEKNGMFGTNVYIDPNYNGSIPNSNILNSWKFKNGYQPEGWILLSEFRNNKKIKNSSYGRKWYNDGYKNYFLFPIDAENNSSLERGRIGLLFAVRATA